MPSYSTMDLEAHSYEVHMKPYMHNFTLNRCDLRKKLLWASYVLHMKFIWTSYEFRMKWNQIYSYEIHKKFIWTSYGVQMNFSWISYEIKSNLFTWIYMQFVWSSYELHIEELIKLICYAHVIQTRWHEAHKQFAWNTHEIHINFEWFELHLNYINIAWQVHKNFLCTTHEYGLWHPRYVLYMNEPPGACPTKYRIDQIRSNSNFAWNSYRCAFEDSRPIITKVGTRHDSRIVVTCTKFRYDRPTIIEIRGTRIFSKFWIRSNLSIRYLVGQAPGPQRVKLIFGHARYCQLTNKHQRKCMIIYNQAWDLGPNHLQRIMVPSINFTIKILIGNKFRSAVSTIVNMIVIYNNTQI